MPRSWISPYSLSAVAQNRDDCVAVLVEPADATWYVPSVIAETRAPATTVRIGCISPLPVEKIRTILTGRRVNRRCYDAMLPVEIRAPIV